MPEETELVLGRFEVFLDDTGAWMQVGKGGFGCVYVAIDTASGQYVALKRIFSSVTSDLREKFRSEYQLLLRLRHENIVGVLDLVELESRVTREKELCIVMEFVEGGSWADVVAQGALRLTEVTLKKLLRGALHGLRYLHDEGIVHRDIKPENMLIGGTPSEPTVKLCDFGIAAVLEGTHGTTRNGACTVAYASPELLSRGRYSAVSDIWSLAITAIHLATGAVPWRRVVPDFHALEAFPAMFQIACLTSNKEFDAEAIIPSDLSVELRRMLRSMLDPNPDTRATSSKLLSDPYFADNTAHSMDTHLFAAAHWSAESFTPPTDPPTETTSDLQSRTKKYKRPPPKGGSPFGRY